MFTIESHLLRATIQPKGAELTSLFHKGHQLDYLWDADPAFWAKHSPVLFPVVGALKDETYLLGGKAYRLPRHGFARDSMFAVEQQEFDRISFLLKDSEATQSVYPYTFEFRIMYAVVEDSLAVSYKVTNNGKEPMYFSVGGHPAFKLPLVPGTSYADYFLRFDQVEQAGRWPIVSAGLLATNDVPLLQDTDRLPLTKSLFAKDALVFKKLKSTRVSLLTDKFSRGLTVDFPGFPFLGIWAAKDADFICIEPWCGIADPIDTDQDFTRKEGINKLDAGATFTRTWSVNTF